MSWWTWSLVAIGAVAVVAGLRLLGRWAGRRGFVYNRHNPRPPGAGVPMLLERIYQPSLEHVIEERRPGGRGGSGRGGRGETGSASVTIRQQSHGSPVS